MTRNQLDLISEGGRMIRIAPAWKWLEGKGK